MNAQRVENRIEQLEKRIQELGQKSNASILSSASLRQLVIREKDDIETCRPLFESRKWVELRAKWRGKGIFRDRIIINEFEELNLTPFSYDLSIGSELFSLSSKDGNIKKLDIPCTVEPGESVIVLTHEYIALPPSYAATVWPRFNYVLKGLFQSMVKIDPTWFGQLAVALTNVSRSDVKISRGEQFGTLVIYDLGEDTDLDLLPEKELVPAVIEIGADSDQEAIKNFYKVAYDAGHPAGFNLEGNKISVTGMKQAGFEALKKLAKGNPGLIRTVVRLKTAWLGQKREERLQLGTDALGLSELKPILGKHVSTGQKLERRKFDLETLKAEAMRFGKPFDMIAGIPDYCEQQARAVAKEEKPNLEATIEKKFSENIMPRVIQLMLSLMGIVSLIVAVLALVLRSFSVPNIFSTINVGSTLVLTAICLAGVALPATILVLRNRKECRGCMTKLDELEGKVAKVIHDSNKTPGQPHGNAGGAI